MARSATSLAQIKSELESWASQPDPSDVELQDVVYRSAITGFMSGNLFVRDVELPAKGIELAGGIGVDVTVGASGDFMSLPFTEAIRLFLSKEIVDPEVFYARLDQTVARAFTATYLAKGKVTETAFNSISKILTEGGTFTDFANAVNAEEISLGIAESGHGYLRTVFDTNVQTAYSAGRDEQLTHPAVVEVVPLRIYVAVIDDRTRDEHADLHGKTWDARETDEWREYQGPNGFNCRCQVISAEGESDLSDRLASDLADARGISVSDARQLAQDTGHPEEKFKALPRL